MLINLALDSAS